MDASGFKPLLHAVHDPQMMPTAQPSSRPSARNQRVNNPNTSAGKVCRIHRPPSNCRSSAYCVGRNRMKASAPSFTTSEVIFATAASPAWLMAGLTYDFQTLRVNRFAAPMLITAAGTSAPIAIAAKAKPANHDGNSAWNSAGTTSLGVDTLIFAAYAM